MHYPAKNSLNQVVDFTPSSKSRDKLWLRTTCNVTLLQTIYSIYCLLNKLFFDVPLNENLSLVLPSTCSYLLCALRL